MLNVLTLLISGVKFCYYRFYRSKTKRQDAKNKCYILLLTVIYSTRIQHGRISALFSEATLTSSTGTVTATESAQFKKDAEKLGDLINAISASSGFAVLTVGFAF